VSDRIRNERDSEIQNIWTGFWIA